MMILHTLLPLLFSFILADTSGLQLQHDIEKDLNILQHDSRIYISDNTSVSPSVQTVANDLQLFAVAAAIDVSKAKYSSQTQGDYQVEVWQFPEGEMKAVYQITSNIHLDTVVMQRYLDNRPPTQQHITNNFRFRAYAVATASVPVKLYYLTEADQGLLAYHINDRQVQIGYAHPKEGLSNILPVVEQETERILRTMAAPE